MHCSQKYIHTHVTQLYLFTAYFMFTVYCYSWVQLLNHHEITMHVCYVVNRYSGNPLPLSPDSGYKRDQARTEDLSFELSHWWYIEFL